MELIFISILAVLIVIILYLASEERTASAAERKDLYDRLMSRSFSEYKDNVHMDDNLPKDTTVDETVELDDAKEEIANG